jgi:hypothetical protein
MGSGEGLKRGVKWGIWNHTYHGLITVADFIYKKYKRKRFLF